MQIEDGVIHQGLTKAYNTLRVHNYHRRAENIYSITRLFLIFMTFACSPEKQFHQSCGITAIQAVVLLLSS